MSAQQVADEFADYSAVGGRMTGVFAALAVARDDIKHSVQSVFDVSVPSHIFLKSNNFTRQLLNYLRVSVCIIPVVPKVRVVITSISDCKSTLDYRRPKQFDIHLKTPSQRCLAKPDSVGTGF